jgi:hypothetical protein
MANWTPVENLMGEAMPPLMPPLCLITEDATTCSSLKSAG